LRFSLSFDRILAITFSAEKAVTLLREQNLRPVRFVWDFESDGEPNDETVLPLTTAIYEKSGVYTMSARIDLEGGETRTLYRRISIPTAVFSVSPMPPIVEQTVRFSVTHLLSDPKLLAEVDWDFDGDGQKDATVKTTDVAHTYYATGNYNVSATIRLNNQSQRTLSRMIEVTEPAPLPFPVTLTTEPATLVGPAPFGAGFTLETKEPIREIQWTFGDDKEERGASLKKVLHSFDQPGIYPVTAKVRSASGKLAEITTIVRVTEVLQLSDLRFDMQPPLRNSSVSGEVPLNVTITPLTSVPLIQFAWEAPGASAVSKTGSTLTATYRKEGNYQITLIAEDPEGKVLRYPINVKANPPQADIVINLRPSTGTAPLRVEFDVSNSYIPPGQNVIGYEWTYGDEKQAGAKPELGLAKTEHVYQQPGEYTVNLRIVLSDGKDYKAWALRLYRYLGKKMAPMNGKVNHNKRF
jgi:PKD repeat protein